MTPRLVVKLGGSYTDSPLLRRWLHAFLRAPGSLVLVPGGGPFADAVRHAQPSMGFDDRAAHDMALLAMTQFGRALVSLQPHFVLAENLDAILHLCATGRVPVWSPWPMLRDAPDIPPSWEITSDSLSLWLTRALGAPHLLLVKHCTVPPNIPAISLTRDGILDPAFPRFLDGYAGHVHIAAPEHLPVSGIDPANPPGHRLLS
jgi:5-(aminomethyl)-3-furanmethanol phosphate kinase